MALVTVQRSPNSVDSPQCSDGEAEDEEGNKNEKSECFFAGKGTALVLALKDIPQHHERRLSTDSTRSTNSTQSNNSDIQQHLQSMFNLLPPEETLKMAVKLESQRPNRTRYLVIASRCCYRGSTGDRKIKITRNNSARAVSTASAAAGVTARQMSVDSGISNKASQSQSQMEASESSEPEKRLSSLSAGSSRQRSKSEAVEKSASGDSKCAWGADEEHVDGEGIEESCLLGIDCNETTTIGLVVPILADTTIHLDGDGGFSVSVFCKTHIFKPVSVQAMWSALQTLHKVSEKARENNFYPGGPSHDWLSYYERSIKSEQSCLNEWNTMDALESRRPPSPDAIRNKPTAKEETESVIKMKLKEIMMTVDLDEVTSKYIRGHLEEHLDMDLGEYKSFIDKEMLIILGQMDSPTEIFEHVYLGSEWNASNLEELQRNGVGHILNVTREIDNFFPGMFNYFNVRVYDDEKTNLLKHWENTFQYITQARSEKSKVLVHCKMGVSRSASVVIAYAMKAYNWEFDQALQHVKDRRSCIKPNKNFLAQLETYRGMLDAMRNKEKLQRSKSETNLKSTKDARLLPGSEPTPLIQALNQSKSRSAGHGVESGGDGVSGAVSVTVSSASSSASDQKQRRVVRRSSSTSPKSIQGHTAATVVVKQQSQSLENLTPERSIAADEPRNVRFPGSNGENYSVTQNQVLHIQKNTPPPPPPPPPPTSVRNIVHDLETHGTDMRKTADDRKTLNLQFTRSVSQDPTSTGVLELNTEDEEAVPPATGSVKSLGSPVWTSSAKLITQTSIITDGSAAAEASIASLRRSLRRSRCDTFGSSLSSSDAGDMFSSQLDNVFAREEEKRHSRKSQSWAATSGASGGIVMDERTCSGAGAGELSASSKLGSNSSIDSGASSNATTSTMYEGQVRTRPRQREIPSRHASWGSGDNRCGVPMRNSSWGSYDTNRNNFLQYGSAAACAIFEGQIHELNMSYKTASHSHAHTNTAATTVGGSQRHVHSHHLGTVKRTKQKLEERTALKKLCQENDGAEASLIGAGSSADEEANSTRGSTLSLSSTSPQKRSSNLYRSSSAAGSIRSRYPNRCNSEEIVPSNLGNHLPRVALRRSDGSRPLQADLFSASAPEAYTMSDIENKNTLPQQEVDVADEDATSVTLRTTQAFAGSAAAATDDQRISGNVQTLKKSFEAKAGVTTGATSSAASGQLQAGNVKKGHQSLPSSPVAQHVDHSEHAEPAATAAIAATISISATTTIATVAASTASSGSSSSSSSSSVSESYDRVAVKGLVHRYQPTHSSVHNAATTSSPPANSTSSSFGNYRPRPRSYYENSSAQKSLTGKPHDYSESRPPPAPAKSATGSGAHTHSHRHSHSQAAATPQTETMLTQQQQPPQRRQKQELSKSHPLTTLTRLKMSQQTFNAAAYNTM